MSDLPQTGNGECLSIEREMASTSNLIDPPSPMPFNLSLLHVQRNNVFQELRSVFLKRTLRLQMPRQRQKIFRKNSVNLFRNLARATSRWPSQGIHSHTSITINSRTFAIFFIKSKTEVIRPTVDQSYSKKCW